jgi:2-C-methyl-D-erythritol 4-phosphate cytidylyltransferase
MKTRNGLFADVPEEQWNDWHWQVRNRAETLDDLKKVMTLTPDEEEGVVGIHDGVRPFVSLDVIKRCYEEARKKKAVIPVMPVTDTLRDTVEGRNVYRENYKIVQTPQTFDIQLLKEANRQPYTEEFTDDASVVEAIGQEVTMVEGNRENIKITTPFDLKIADVINS